MPGLAPALVVACGAALAWSLFDLVRRFLSRRLSAWSLVVWITLPALPIAAAWGVVADDWRLEPGYLVPGVASTVINVVANYLYFRSFQLSPLSVTLPMLSLTPVFSTLFGAVVLGEPLVPRALAGIACVVFGAFRLSTGGGRALAARVEPGSLLMALVALCWSATLLLDKLALGHASAPVHTLVVHAGVAAAGCAILAARGRLGELAVTRASGLLLAAAPLVGVGAFGAQLYAIQALPIGLVETLKRGLGGALAVVWGRACFAEPVTWPKLVAVGLMVGGVALLLL